MSGMYIGTALHPKIHAFCYRCKAPTPPDWTTGNERLNSFIMESWNNTMDIHDAYIQWIEYRCLLANIREMTTLLRHGCTHIADWLEPIANEWTKVILKQIVDADFYQVNILCVNNANSDYFIK